MIFMHLIMFSDFIQVLLIKRRHPTNNEHFSHAYSIYYNLYITGTELTPRNYSEHKIVMSIFV
jgi:hypothetical protein